MNGEYMKAFGLALIGILVAVTVITGALGKMIIAATLWCADQPAWMWVAVLAVITVGLYFKDRSK